MSLLFAHGMNRFSHDLAHLMNSEKEERSYRLIFCAQDSYFVCVCGEGGGGGGGGGLGLPFFMEIDQIYIIRLLSFLKLAFVSHTMKCTERSLKKKPTAFTFHVIKRPYEPRQKKTCLWGLRPGKTQTKARYKPACAATEAS